MWVNCDLYVLNSIVFTTQLCIHHLSRPHTIKTILKALKPKVNRIGEDPTSRSCRNSTKLVPCIALAVGSNFASCLARNRRSHSHDLHFLSLPPLLSQPIWSRLGQETCHLNATCPILCGSWDYTLYLIHLLWDFHPIA